ncbi:MAG: type II secretion system protein [Planctomycetota bacterium]
MGPRISRRSCGGFTLIELLVVVAIIAMLVSILLPSLGTAMEIGRTSTCMTSMRTLGSAIYTYASENDRYLVPGEYFLSDQDGETDTLETILAGGDYVRAAWTDQRDSIPSGPTTFRCPSGVEEVIAITDLYNRNADPYADSSCQAIGRRHLDGNEEAYVQTWYGLNLRTTEPRPFPFLRWSANRDNNILYRLDAVHASDRLVAMYDGIWSHNYWKYGRISGRHMNRRDTNVNFIDGSCRTFRRAQLPFTGSQLRESTDPAWLLTSQ